MEKGKSIGVILTLLLIASALLSHCDRKDKRFISFQMEPGAKGLKMYWKDDANQNFGSIQNLKSHLESKGEKMVFAMNGGMYKRDHSPLGLFIQDGNTKSALDTLGGEGNFYLKPNGVFYVHAKKGAAVCKTGAFVNDDEITYATQSGPMLVIDGKLHPALQKGSTNLRRRNGVGVLRDGKVLFAMSRGEISFYDFAEYFRKQGCKNALYLDGFVSRTYLSEEGWIQTDGDFGVIIAVSEKSKK